MDSDEPTHVLLDRAPSVYAISDLHTNIPENMKWVESLSQVAAVM